MEDLLFRLSPNDAGQLLDGLDVLIEQWQATSHYLKTGESKENACIREASDAEEADAIAQMYQGIYEKIRGQILEARK